MEDISRDEEYFELIASALRVCAQYKPMFGKGRKGGLSLEQFQLMHRADPFYNWMGLDSPLMYAAHKAAGGMTSIYRQLGMGAERVFRHVLQNTLGLSKDESGWNYDVPSSPGETRTLYLDGRIDYAHIRNTRSLEKVRDWVIASGQELRLLPELMEQIKGVVFEVRQGYKSKDSKRQNADISNASNAYANLYIPVLILLSTQIDDDLALRYKQARWLLLIGIAGGNATQSTYTFCKEVLGYDLAAFFERNSPRIKAELEAVLSALLETH